MARREDGKLEYRLKRPSPGGATTLVMTPLQLLKRLCALMVKPRVHLTRYFGVFGPNARARAQVVPARTEPQPPEPLPRGTQLKLSDEADPPRATPVRPRLDWALLLRRTWGFDVFDCPCGGRRSVLALVTSPALARQILDLSSRVQPRPLRSTGPPQLELALH